MSTNKAIALAAVMVALLGTGIYQLYCAQSERAEQCVAHPEHCVPVSRQ